MKVDITGAHVAERSVKNLSNSFEVITPFERLTLQASDRSEMDQWIAALKKCAVSATVMYTIESHLVRPRAVALWWIPSIIGLYCHRDQPQGIANTIIGTSLATRSSVTATSVGSYVTPRIIAWPARVRSPNIKMAT